jgi:excisionase family DNA binding protein
MPSIEQPPARGLTSDEVAKRLRVSPDKVRGWIKAGALKAINTASARCRKPRFVVTPESLAEFERKHSAAEPPKPNRARRRPAVKDFFPG